MTEQKKITSSVPDTPQEAKERRQATMQNSGELNRKVSIDWILRLTIPAVFVTTIFYLFVYFQTDAWQLLIAVGGMVIALAGFFWARRSFLRAHLDAAGYWIVSAAIIGCVCLGLTFPGASFWLILGGILVVLLLGMLTLPQRWLVWSTGAALLGIYFLVIDLFDPLIRYDVAQ